MIRLSAAPLMDASNGSAMTIALADQNDALDAPATIATPTIANASATNLRRDNRSPRNVAEKPMINSGAMFPNTDASPTAV